MSSEMLYLNLRSQIEAEKLKLGSRLPTEAELCEQFSVARGTVRKALQRLADEGYIRAGQGKQRVVQRRQPLKLERLKISSKSVRSGTPGKADRLSPSFGEYLRGLGLEPTDVVLRNATNVPCYTLTEEPRFDVGTQVSEALHISPESEVHWFVRLRLANGEPIVLQSAVIVANLLPDISLDFLIPGGLTQLYQRHGIHRYRVSSTYGPTRASKFEATYLRVGTGAPMLEERRVSYYLKPGSRTEAPYEYLLALYPERLALTFDWEDVQQRRGQHRPSDLKSVGHSARKPRRPSK